MDRPTPSGSYHRTRRLRLVAPPEAASSDAASAPGKARSRPHDWSALMTRAQDGDRGAYRTLLVEVTPYLRALAARCFRMADDIEDAVQDVLLAVHAVRHAYDPSRPFGPWLVAIANRRIIDRLRRQTRAHFREIELTPEHETFSNVQANLQANLEDTSLDETGLHDAIGRLPADQRQAIRLLKLQEMSLREAALASGRSVNALKVATHRGIARLRKLLLTPSNPT